MSQTLTRKLLPLLLALVMMVLPLAAAMAVEATPTDLKTVLNINWTIPADKEYDGKAVDASAITAVIANPEAIIDTHPDVKVEYAIYVGDTEVTEIKDAGTYTFKASLTDTEQYRIGEGAEATFTISPATVTIKVDDKSKVYGTAADPELTYKLDKPEFDSEITGVKLSRNIGKETKSGEKNYENVGKYTISATYNENSNFTVNVETGTFTITKLPVTVKPDLKTGQEKKVYGEADPAWKWTLSDEAHLDETDGNLGREEGENVGTYKLTQGTVTCTTGNLELSFEEGTTFEITKKPATLTADALSKKFGAADPELTYTTEDLVEGDAFDVLPSRAPGEAVGEYEITFEEGENPNYDITPVPGIFTIEPEFAGAVAVKTEKVTNRSTAVDFTVSGIAAELGEKEQPVLKLELTDAAKTAGVTAAEATVTKDDTYNMAVTGAKLTDAASQQSYFSYLPAGTYNVILSLPKADGTTADQKVTTLTVDPDTIPISVQNENATNDGRGLIGKEAGDKLSFKLGDFTTRGLASTDSEIIKVTMSVNGQAVYGEGKYMTASAAKATICEDLASFIPAGSHQVPVSVTAEVVSPDLTATKATRDFTYDVYALPLADDNIVDLNNRANSFKVNLPEKAKITEVTLTGFNNVDVSRITYTGAEGTTEYGTVASIPVSFNASNLPQSNNVEVTIKVEDFAGNVTTYTAKGIKQGSVKAVSLSNIEPQATAQDDGYVLKGTNVVRISGYAVGHEKLNVSLTAPNGFKYTTSVTVGSESNGYDSQAQDFWEVVIGDRKSEENLELPVGVPITLKVNYADASGGGYKTVLIYDDVCQEAKPLTPAYPGMTVMTGYAEAGSKVSATWGSEGKADAIVTGNGFFVIVFPEAIFDPEITLTVTDIAGNASTQTIEVPGRSRDVNMVVNAYPVGTPIQDDTSMVQFVATSVDLEKLAEGPIEIPILAANYFEVGTMTVTLGEDGTVTFEPAIGDGFGADGKAYFNVYDAEPAADALSDENRGAGLDIAAGYKPAEGAKSFWFVYETPVTLTGDQLTNPEGAATVDAENAFQANN